VDIADVQDTKGIDLKLGRQCRQEQPPPILALVGRVTRIAPTRPHIRWYLLLRRDDVELAAATDHDAMDSADADHLTESCALPLDQRSDRGRGCPHPLHIQRNRIDQVNRTAVE